MRVDGGHVAPSGGEFQWPSRKAHRKSLDQNNRLFLSFFSHRRHRLFASSNLLFRSKQSPESSRDRLCTPHARVETSSHPCFAGYAATISLWAVLFRVHSVYHRGCAEKTVFVKENSLKLWKLLSL